ncbi:hypothetical protein CDD83_9198 [Cordyceps sp. RAO-2017]|nr:hypothetical protein CDD83_9198 [Cordyceps sp. RAO-2017]
MARADNLFLEDDEPDPILDSPSIGRAVAKPRPAGGGAAPAGDDEAEDLVSRTQRSMAGFEKARQKAQLERRRSQRKSRASPRKESSLFPAVDEETARDSTMLAEELMGEEDMEAVFRSRPKIKASPIPSPTREWADASYE